MRRCCPCTRAGSWARWSGSTEPGRTEEEGRGPRRGRRGQARGPGPVAWTIFRRDHSRVRGLRGPEERSGGEPLLIFIEQAPPTPPPPPPPPGHAYAALNPDRQGVRARLGGRSGRRRGRAGWARPSPRPRLSHPCCCRPAREAVRATWLLGCHVPVWEGWWLGEPLSWEPPQTQAGTPQSSQRLSWSVREPPSSPWRCRAGFCVKFPCARGLRAPRLCTAPGRGRPHPLLWHWSESVQ